MERGNADRAELRAIRSGLPGCREPGRKLIAMEMGDRDKLGDEEEKPADGGQPPMPRAQLDAACDHRFSYWRPPLSAQHDTIKWARNDLAHGPCAALDEAGPCGLGRSAAAACAEVHPRHRATSFTLAPMLSDYASALPRFSEVVSPVAGNTRVCDARGAGDPDPRGALRRAARSRDRSHRPNFSRRTLLGSTSLGRRLRALTTRRRDDGDARRSSPAS